jgi:hypothetical protein
MGHKNIRDPEQIPGGESPQIAKVKKDSAASVVKPKVKERVIKGAGRPFYVKGHLQDTRMLSPGWLLNKISNDLTRVNLRVYD